MTSDPISVVLIPTGLTIKGSSVGTESQLSELLNLALEGVITPAIEVFEFAETPRLIRQLTRDEIKGRAVVKIPVE
jgi:propanol-preferring alcohol dehydrogenase